MKINQSPYKSIRHSQYNRLYRTRKKPLLYHQQFIEQVGQGGESVMIFVDYKTHDAICRMNPEIYINISQGKESNLIERDAKHIANISVVLWVMSVGSLLDCKQLNIICFLL